MIVGAGIAAPGCAGPEIVVGGRPVPATTPLTIADPWPVRAGRRPPRLNRRQVRLAARAEVRPVVTDGALGVAADASASCRGGKPHSTDVALEAVSCAFLELAAVTNARGPAWSVSYRTFDLVPTLRPRRLDRSSRQVVDRALMADLPWGCSLPDPAVRQINAEVRAHDGPTVCVVVSDLEVWPPQADGGLNELTTSPADEVLVLLLGGVVPPPLAGTGVHCVPVQATTPPTAVAREIVRAANTAEARWLERTTEAESPS